MKKIFLNTCFFLGMTIAVNAQMKVGTNPTTIGTNSNLELEAPNGGKFTVTKDSAKVIIKDGSQGAGKVLTSDENGVSSWKDNYSGSWTAIWYNFTAPATGNLTGGAVLRFGEGGTVSPGNIVVPETGLYKIITSSYAQVVNGNTVCVNFQLLINGNTDAPIFILDNNIVPNDGAMFIATNQFRQFTKGDILTFRRQPLGGAIAPGPITSGSIEITLMRKN